MNRTSIVGIFEVKNCNPNGDVDKNNRPRTQRDTGCGVVTDVCLKRKIRDAVASIYGDDIIFALKNSYLNKRVEESLKELLAEEKKNVDSGILFMKKYWDARAFGAILNTLKDSSMRSKSIRGPVSVSMAISVDPVSLQNYSCSRSYGCDDGTADKGLMLYEKAVVVYGLYRFFITIDTCGAENTNFTDEDYDILVNGLKNMFTLDYSTSRPIGCMNLLHLFEFKHNSKFGSCPDYKIESSVQIKKNEKIEVPVCLEDYTISIDTEYLNSKNVKFCDLMENYQ